MMLTTIPVLLILLYGVCGESPTAPPDQWYVESSVSKDANRGESFSEERPDVLLWTETDRLDALQYELSKEPVDDSVWTPYPPEIYPLFKQAVKELAASEHGILIFWDTINRPKLPREFSDQIFTAYNRLVSEHTSSTTEETSVSETVEDSQYTVEEEASSSEVSSTEYHTSLGDSSAEYLTSDSNEEDQSGVYYTTEGPMVEAMLTDEAVYASTMSPETQDNTSEEPNMYMTSTGEVYEATTVVENEETSEDSVSAVSEAEEGLIMEKRSGDMAEEHYVEGSEDHCKGCPLQVGSIRGIPGVQFPNYDDIPITSFSCADKRIPGFYADLETGCQVFHVCWPHRRESFLCPVGTLFNQAILACDYWYSTNCSLSALYFDVTTLSPKPTSPEYEKPTENPIFSTEEYEKPTEIPHEEYERPLEIPDERPHVDLDWFRVSKFVPVKSKVTVYTKHSSKKPGLKYVVKQKHDVLPIVDNFLELTKNIAKNAVRIIPEVHVVKQGIPKSKLAKVSPAAKLQPCLKVKDVKVEHRRPTPPVVKKPQSLPHLDPRFIVQPVVVQRPVVHIKEVVHKVPLKVVKPVHKVAIKSSKFHAPETVLKSLDVAGHVLQRGILDLTRQAMVGGHVKSKH
ncbi:hypothetical protein JTE90_004561 [Oedothorax gibbosus]|uniref:Chitin-binding type-2 domain-containing protein n=1 Tax=Oedothorax gibbosus TaxID=931172 RepID=A0AAV6UL15_9ARAC|nr:hypothetical protein JTE90_004561 [Oedothorax gibbosus]